MRYQSAAGAALTIALATAAVFAEPSAQDKAAAEVLFRSGTQLMERRQFLEACEKFDASDRLDPALGTRLWLADCYDRAGKTASAWALFVEVADRAQAAGQTERASVASVRAADLELRLARLVLVLPPDVPADLVLSLNEKPLPRASWSDPIPIDPGKQILRATAGGYVPWSGEIVAELGPSEARIEIPALDPLPKRAPGPAPPRPAGSSTDGGLGATRVAGYASAGTGVVSLGVAAVFGYLAYDRNQDSLSQCSSADANACTPLGKALRDDARSHATVSTVTAVAGAALLGAGITLLVLTPPATKGQHAGALALQVRASGAGGGLRLEGSFF